MAYEIIIIHGFYFSSDIKISKCFFAGSQYRH